MLTLAELATLPLRAAVFDDAGNQVVSTPEWRGAGASAVPYQYEGYMLVVAAPSCDEGAPATVAEALVRRLITALEDAARTLDEIQRRRLAVLVEGVRIASGRVALNAGTSADVAGYLQAALPVRSHVRLHVSGAGAHGVVAPAAVAAALLQIVVNADVHAQADDVDLRVLSEHDSLTFRLQWAGTPPDGPPLQTSRAQRSAERTGLATVRVIADAVGASVSGLLPGVDATTGMVDRGRTRMELALPATDLTLPLARVEGGSVRWCTRTWTEETGLLVGQSVDGEVARCVEHARAAPGEIAQCGTLSGRMDEESVWIAQPPDDPTERSIFAARLVEHERALAAAPPPHRGRIRALATVVMHVLGERLPTVSGDTWTARIGEELSSYGLVADVPAVDAERVITPPVCAYLMSECGSALVQDGEDLALAVRPGMSGDPLVQLLSEDGERIVLTP